VHSPVLATVELSVRPSIRLSHAGIVSKRRTLGSRNLHRRIAQGFHVLVPFPLVISSKNVPQVTLLSGDIRFMRIFAGVPWEGHQTTVGLSTTALFSVFAGYFFGNFKDKASVISDKQSVIGFSVIPKCMTLNDVEWLYFALNSVFAPVWLAFDRATFKNNCVKTNKDRHNTVSSANR